MWAIPDYVWGYAAVLLPVAACCAVLGVALSYLILRYMYMGCDEWGVFFNEYSQCAARSLSEVGHYPIHRAFLVRTPLPKVMTTVLNLATLFRYEHYISQSVDNKPYHVCLLCELRLPNGSSRLVLIDKNNVLSVRDRFTITDAWELQRVRGVRRAGHTIRSLLEQTRARIGEKRFFNWNLFENNCQAFTRELLVTLKRHRPRHEQFICRDRIVGLLESTPTDFTIHVLNCIHICCNLIESFTSAELSRLFI